MVYESEQLRCERGLRNRGRPPARDTRRNLYDVVVSETGQRSGVPRVDDVDCAVAGAQRLDEADRGFAVERTAPPLEERRRLGQVRIAVHLEQLALDLRDRLRPRHAVLLLGEHPVVCVEVVQVIGRDRADVLEDAPRQLGFRGDLVSVLGHELGQDVVAVELHRADPGQVIQADLVDEDALRGHIELSREHALERDRHVAEPRYPVSCIE